MGNHYHLLAKFPHMNRAQFMRSFNSVIAKLVSEHIPSFKEGRLWARRYSFQAVPRNEDILHWFQYLTLNPVSSGLCKNTNNYNSYNSYKDSLRDVRRTFKVLDRMQYNDKVRFNSKIRKKDFVKSYTLKYSRLPGFSKLSESEYVSIISNMNQVRRKEMIRERLEKGQGFASKEALRGARVGARPGKTKKSSRNSFRPLVLTLCKETKKAFLESYFILLKEFQDASKKFRKGVVDIVFPPGTYASSLVAVV
jgi:hypothetical protein